MTDNADEEALRAIDNDMLTECQGKLKIAEEENRHLKVALQSARRIGAAIGILMHREKITDDAAFERLATVSKDTNRKLRDLADQVVLTGEL